MHLCRRLFAFEAELEGMLGWLEWADMALRR